MSLLKIVSTVSSLLSDEEAFFSEIKNHLDKSKMAAVSRLVCYNNFTKDNAERAVEIFEDEYKKGVVNFLKDKELI